MFGNKKNKGGFGMIEVVVGASIISLVAFSVASVATISTRLSNENANNTKAAFLMEEGVEAVKIMRDASWVNISSLNTTNDYYLTFNGLNWATTTSNVFIDGVFERKLRLEGVNRDANQDIVTSGGTLDPDIKKITVSVSWRVRSATTTKSISTYLTNMF